MERPCWTVELRQISREELEDLFIFTMGILSTTGRFMAMTPQEMYDWIVETKKREDGE